MRREKEIMNPSPLYLYCMGPGPRVPLSKDRSGGIFLNRLANSQWLYMDFCDDHLSQNPDNRETGYSIVLPIHYTCYDSQLGLLTQYQFNAKPCNITQHLTLRVYLCLLDSIF